MERIAGQKNFSESSVCGERRDCVWIVRIFGKCGRTANVEDEYRNCDQLCVLFSSNSFCKEKASDWYADDPEDLRVYLDAASSDPAVIIV